VCAFEQTERHGLDPIRMRRHGEKTQETAQAADPALPLLTQNPSGQGAISRPGSGSRRSSALLVYQEREFVGSDIARRYGAAMARGKCDPVLHPAGGRDNTSSPMADVVFIHGGDADTTWQQGDSWRPNWIAESGEHLAVWSLDYDAEPSAWLGRAIPLVTELATFLTRFEADGLGKRPLVLICHKCSRQFGSHLGNPGPMETCDGHHRGSHSSRNRHCQSRQ
jgi:hypothetical protein